MRQEASLTIHHPRYLVIPKIGMMVTPHTLYRTLKRSLSNLLAAGRRFDLIDAHYFYPDGVAAVRLGRHFGIPVCVTARGTDVNLIPEHPGPRRMIADAALHADGLITVCQALKDRLIEIAPQAAHIAVLRNGVDLDRFRPIDRHEARASLGCTRRTLGSVGLLIERKGHHHVINALRSLPDTDLLIVGEGPERTALEQLSRKMGVADRVRFLGLVEQSQLARVYSAMDALVLASSREGWANVLLEAMACGTPVVASRVWGTPEVVSAPEAGVLMASLDAPGVVEGINKLFTQSPKRDETRRFAERFSWEATTQGQIALFNQIIQSRYPNRAA
jgi:teichuronic acid biosynthesis glycosyltransferase TuaC